MILLIDSIVFFKTKKGYDIYAAPFAFHLIPYDLKQPFQNLVLHQIRQRDLQFRLCLHGAFDGKGGAFVAGPVAAGDTFVVIPMVLNG